MKFATILSLTASVELRQKLDLESDTLMGKSHHMVMKLEEQMEMLQTAAKSGKAISPQLKTLIGQLQAVTTQCTAMIGGAHLKDSALLKDAQELVEKCEKALADSDVSLAAMETTISGYTTTTNGFKSELDALKVEQVRLEKIITDETAISLTNQKGLENSCCHKYTDSHIESEYCCNFKNSTPEACKAVFTTAVDATTVKDYFTSKCSTYDSYVTKYDNANAVILSTNTLLTSQKELVLSKQGQYDSALQTQQTTTCSKVSQRNNAIGSYDLCRTRDADAFNAEKASVIARQNIRYNEFKSVQHIACLLNTMAANGFEGLLEGTAHENACGVIYTKEFGQVGYPLQGAYCNPIINAAIDAPEDDVTRELMINGSDLYDGLMISQGAKYIVSARTEAKLDTPEYCS